MYTISRRPTYLLVTLEGEVTYQTFKDAIEEELAMDEYPNMNDIWQFDQCVLSVHQNQLKPIVNDVLQIYPQQASRTKTALVASSGISGVLLHLWAEHANTLPYEIQIFMSLQEAEAWIA